MAEVFNVMMQQILQYSMVRARLLRAASQRLQPASIAPESICYSETPITASVFCEAVSSAAKGIASRTDARNDAVGQFRNDAVGQFLSCRMAAPAMGCLQERDPQHHSLSGQALVEFALVLMFVILPFTFVLIDGSMVLFTLASMTNAAREAAHAGSIFQETTYTSQYATIDAGRLTYIRQEAQSFASPLIPFSQCVTTVVYSPQTPDTDNIYRAMDSMSVTLACPHRLFFGLVGTGQITLTAQSTMRIEPGGVAPPPLP